MPVKNDIPTHLNMRIDPKLRYLLDLASRARGISLTEYIEEALKDSFKRVSLDQYPELSEEPEVYDLSPAERREKFRRRQEAVPNPLSEIADRLWSERPVVRLQLLAVSGFDHLMSDDDRRLWNHIVSRKNLRTKDGKLDLKLIEEKWKQIQFGSLHDAIEAKKKGNK